MIDEGLAYELTDEELDEMGREADKIFAEVLTWIEANQEQWTIT